MSEKDIKHGASVGKNENTESVTQAASDGNNNLKFITSSGHHHRRHRSEASKKRRNKRKRKKLLMRILITLGIIILSLAVIVTSAVVLLYHTGKNEMKSDKVSIEAPTDATSVDNGEYIYYNGEKYRYNKDIINMLFIGVDENNGKETDGIGANGQSDVIALGAIDSKSNKFTMINIPRDIMTDVKVYSLSGGYSGVEKMQIALSYAYGDGGDTSCINTMSAVRTLFYNVPISSYFALQMRGIPDVNDNIGGVTVKSPNTIEPFQKGQTYHLMGDDALYFVSKRDMTTADANLKRNERQRIYLKSFINTFIKETKSDFSTPIKVFNASKPYSFTNLNANRITYLATEFILNRDMKIETKSVPVTVKQNGDRAENYVKDEEFYKLFLSVFYEKVDK